MATKTPKEVRDTENNSPAALLHQLVKATLGAKKDADISQHFQYAVRVVSSNFAPSIESDEFHVAERIKRKLAREGRESDAAYFSELHRKLQSQGKLQNRWAILYFLLSLADSNKETKQKPSSAVIFGRGLPNLATSTPFVPRNLHQTPVASEIGSYSHSGTQSSGIGSGISSISGPTPTPHSYAPGYLTTPGVTVAHDPQSVGSRLAQMLIGGSQSHVTNPNLASASRGQVSEVTKRNASALSPEENTSFELAEVAIVRDLVYVFQGIDGKLIKYSYNEDAYRMDSQVGVPRPVRDLVHKLAELGWLFCKVKKYVEKKSQDKSFGLVGQSFTAALQQELTEYYRLLAVLEAQQQETDDAIEETSSSALTLFQLSVWTFDPLHRMKQLAILVDGCKDKKGGALASAIHSYTLHGDRSVRALVSHILKLVAFPLWKMLDKWIYDGLLEDKYHEFFVAADPSVKEEKLWHEKYTLRKSMVPSFIKMDQARQILLIGKSINFLRQVCKDHTPIIGKGTEEVIEKHSKYENTEMFLDQDLDNTFQEVIDKAYQDTSRKLLDVLHQRFKFLDHLKAMRRYLLLGQGDFIKHLMDLLQSDLVKQAQVLYLHNLTGVLETAIRATNAQYDDSEILDRLDVRLLELSPGDTGWDVFSLDYHVDGPISTVFTPQCKILYLRVFNFLWRAKRMEYILTQVWKDQMCNARLLKDIPELSPLLHHMHTLASEMVHFIHQMQYYINFEVMECSYDELWKRVNKANDLDHIISAHEVFLDTILKRSLLDEESQPLLTQLRVIFDLIVQFEGMQEEFFKTSLEELERRKSAERAIEERTEMGKWGTTELEEKEKKRLHQEFQRNFIPSERAKLRVLSQTLQDMVQKFLVMLTAHSDDSLRLLAVRLDFNEVYKAREPKLRSPVAYMKRKKREY